MKILIINLPESTQRKNHMLENMRKFGITNFEFIEAPRTPTGSMQAHQKAWQRIIQLNQPAIVFEDDIILHDTFYHYATQRFPIIENYCDVALIGYQIKEGALFNTIYPHWRFAQPHAKIYFNGCYAYIVNGQQAAKKLLQLSTTYAHHPDLFIMDEANENRLSLFFMNHPVAYHGSFPSTLTHAPTNTVAEAIPTTFTLPRKKQNYIVSIYLTGSLHRTPSFKSEPQINQLRKWAESVYRADLQAIVFHNCFSQADIQRLAPLPVKFIEVTMPHGQNSGLYRFTLYQQLLTQCKNSIAGVFFTDSTDVELLHNPFTHPKFNPNKIYIGNEPAAPHFYQWMNQHSTGYAPYQKMVSNKKMAQHAPLNAGIIGGSLKAIAPFINRMAAECAAIAPDLIHFQDMPIVNHLAHTEFKKQIAHSPLVNTEFKADERYNTTAWFKHK